MPCAASCGKMCVKMSKCMIHSLCRWFQSVVYALYFADVLWLTGWESGLLRSRSWKNSRYGSRKSSHGGTGKKKNTQNFRTRLHKRIHVPFRQILLHPAWKILAGRQPACVFLPCLQQNYARKSTYISCEDRFLTRMKSRTEYQKSAGKPALLFFVFWFDKPLQMWYTKALRAYLKTVGGRFQLPWFYNRWEVMYMENFVTWEQLRFFAWLILTLIQIAILRSNHHDDKRK